MCGVIPRCIACTDGDIAARGSKSDEVALLGVGMFDDVGKQFIGDVEKQFGVFLGKMIQFLKSINYFTINCSCFNLC